MIRKTLSFFLPWRFWRLNAVATLREGGSLKNNFHNSDGIAIGDRVTTQFIQKAHYPLHK